MTDAVIVIVAVGLLGLLGTVIHSLVRLAADRFYPLEFEALPETTPTVTQREIWLDMVRKRKRQRLELYRAIDRDLSRVLRPD